MRIQGSMILKIFKAVLFTSYFRACPKKYPKRSFSYLSLTKTVLFVLCQRSEKDRFGYFWDIKKSEKDRFGYFWDIKKSGKDRFGYFWDTKRNPTKMLLSGLQTNKKEKPWTRNRHITQIFPSCWSEGPLTNILARSPLVSQKYPKRSFPDFLCPKSTQNGPFRTFLCPKSTQNGPFRTFGKVQKVPFWSQKGTERTVLGTF